MALQLPRGRLKPQKTIPVTLEGVHVPPDSAKPVVLHIRYAGRANAAYFNAQASTPEPKDEGTPAEKATAHDLRAAKIYADTVIDHWDEVADADGVAVGFTPDLGIELLTFLISEEQRPEKFRLVMFLATNPENFAAPVVDVAAVGKS